MTGHPSLRSSTSRNCRQDFGAGPSDPGSPRGRSYVKAEHLLRFTNETFVSRAIDCTNRWLIAAGVYASPATRPTLSRYRSGPRYYLCKFHVRANGPPFLFKCPRSPVFSGRSTVSPILNHWSIESFHACSHPSGLFDPTSTGLAAVFARGIDSSTFSTSSPSPRSETLERRNSLGCPRFLGSSIFQPWPLSRRDSSFFHEALTNLLRE